MTDTALIGSSCPLGTFWSARRYFDYLLDETNLQLLRGKELGQAVIICPSLWENRDETRQNMDRFLKRVQQLIDLLHEVKIERLTFITTTDMQPDTGNEESPLLRDSGDSMLTALLELSDYVNLKFGRVLNIFLPEITGTNAEMSIVDRLQAAPAGATTLHAALLERHQLYPMHRLVKDVEKAWDSGLSAVNLVPEPVTTFELVETCFPSLADRLPVARETDPYGSARTSVCSTHYHDPDTGYIMEKSAVLEGICEALKA